MVEAVGTFEKSVVFYQTTWCSIPEDSHLLKAIILKAKSTTTVIIIIILILILIIICNM
jgi:hypothetical protein